MQDNHSLLFYFLLFVFCIKIVNGIAALVQSFYLVKGDFLVLPTDFVLIGFQNHLVPDSIIGVADYYMNNGAMFQ